MATVLGGIKDPPSGKDGGRAVTSNVLPVPVRE